LSLFRPATTADTPRTPPPRALVSAATLVRQETLRSIAKRKDWQTQAWDMYDEVGEFHSAVNWLGHSLSRCRLYVGELPDDATQGDPTPTTDDRAQQPLDELFGGPSGHPGMLSRLAVHLTVPGESYVIGLDLDAPDANAPAPDGTAQPTPLGPDGEPLAPASERRWLVASQEEFDTKDGKTTVRLPDADRQVQVDVDKSTVIRLWRPHARKAWDADSPARACLPALRELVTTSARINADLESRLAGAGILVVPASASVARTGPADTSNPDAGEQLVDDPDYATLIEAIVTPISDRESASAVVPVLMRVDDESVDKVKHISFSTKLDERVQALRDGAIRRLALGLDVPPEVLLGMTDANHWTGWQIEESAVKISIEPLLGLICAALTEHYLRPALVALSVPNPERYVVAYDVSELVLRPNRFEQALKLWHDGLVGDKAVLREGGFSEDDVPTSTEQARNLLIKLVVAGVPPETAAPYLAVLGLSAPTPITPAEPTPAIDPAPDDDTSTDDRALPDTDGNPDSGQPGGGTEAAAIDVEAAGALRAAGLELAVLRALEIAGKRLLSGAGRSFRGKVAGPSWTIHTHPDLRPREAQLDSLLSGAFDTLRESPLGRAPGAVELVDDYVRQLLLAGVPHTGTYLATAIAQHARRSGQAVSHAAA
jgi:hypothetical protein